MAVMAVVSRSWQEWRLFSMDALVADVGMRAHGVVTALEEGGSGGRRGTRRGVMNVFPFITLNAMTLTDRA